MAVGMDSRFVSFSVFAAFVLAFAVLVAAVNGQARAPAPSSDGTAIDQGIAYVLMVLALVLTYLIHTFDSI